METIELEKKCEQLKAEFNKAEKNYVERKGYYIELRFTKKSDGIRWHFHDKYKVELVVDADVYDFVYQRKDNGAHINICDFVLFSNMDDAILYAVLKEEEFLRKKQRREKE